MGVSGTTILIQTLIMDNETRSAVIYARVSSENDRQDTTRQITDLESYASRENIKIVKVFQEHISGVKKIEERAVLQECLDYCCNNHIDILLLQRSADLEDPHSRYSALWKDYTKPRYPFSYRILASTHYRPMEV